MSTRADVTEARSFVFLGTTSVALTSFHFFGLVWGVPKAFALQVDCYQGGKTDFEGSRRMEVWLATLHRRNPPVGFWPSRLTWLNPGGSSYPKI